jgi:hypothetical protein
MREEVRLKERERDSEEEWGSDPVGVRFSEARKLHATANSATISGDSR